MLFQVSMMSAYAAPTQSHNMHGFVQFAEQVDKLWSYGERSNVYKTGFAVVGPIDQRTHLGTGIARSPCVSLSSLVPRPFPYIVGDRESLRHVSDCLPVCTQGHCTHCTMCILQSTITYTGP